MLTDIYDLNKELNFKITTDDGPLEVPKFDRNIQT